MSSETTRERDDDDDARDERLCVLQTNDEDGYTKSHIRAVPSLREGYCNKWWWWEERPSPRRT